MKDPSQIAVRLTPSQISWLDECATLRAANVGEPNPNRSALLRELIAWAMREGFFGPMGERMKGKKR